MSGDRVSIPHVRALDGLRGVAVAGVLLFHGDHLKGGYLGVDLFFVLSGYLITSLLLAEWRRSDSETGRGRIALGAFWARRARRLLPALALLILGVGLYCAVFASPTELGRIRDDALATIGYVANWRAIFAEQSYFDLFNTPSPLQHTWSLAIEEQFYVFWPLIFVGLVAWWKRRTPAAVLATAIVLGTASALLAIGLYDKADPNRVYYGTDTRAFALFSGIAIAAIVAIWGHTKDRVLRVALEVTAATGGLVLAVMWVVLDAKAPRLYQGGFALAGIAATLVIAAVVHPQRGPIGWILSLAPLCWLGLISYGLYLWHWPVDVVLDADRTGLTGWPLFALRSGVALAIAVASYYLVELPIRRGTWSAAQWRVAIPVAAAALLGIIVATTAGSVEPPRANTSVYAPDRGDQVLLLGDSVANSLASGLVEQGVRVGVVWTPGCRVIHGELNFNNTYSANCDWETAWGGTIAKTSPKRVVALIGVWDLFDVRPSGSSTFVAPGSQGWNEAYAAQLERMIRILGKRGADVTLLTIPCSGISSTAPKEFVRGAFDVNRVKAANVVMRLVAARHPDNVKVEDFFGQVCPNDRYAGVIKGTVMRTDGVHLSPAGANLVAEWLVPRIGLRPRPTTTSTAPATAARQP